MIWHFSDNSVLLISAKYYYNKIFYKKKKKVKSRIFDITLNCLTLSLKLNAINAHQSINKIVNVKKALLPSVVTNYHLFYDMDVYSRTATVIFK